MVIMGIVVLLAIPIFGLTGFHMVLVSRGRTTNEQVTGKFKGGYNPFSRGCWNNCCYTQFGPQYPRWVSSPQTRLPIQFGWFVQYFFSLQRMSRAATKRAGMNGNAGGVGGIPSAISTITSNNQVKTYTADNNGNAHRPTSSAAHAQYNKVRASSCRNIIIWWCDTFRSKNILSAHSLNWKIYSFFSLYYRFFLLVCVSSGHCWLVVVGSRTRLVIFFCLIIFVKQNYHRFGFLRIFSYFVGLPLFSIGLKIFHNRSFDFNECVRYVYIWQVHYI